MGNNDDRSMSNVEATKTLYPSIKTVELAHKEQLGYWWRFLVSPRSPEEVRVLDRIIERFNSMGGWEPQLSKKVGWDARRYPERT